MWVAFPVADIPGAHGFTFGQELHCVMFSDGRFQYGLGAGAVTSAARAPTEAQVIAGAQALYRRVHSR